MDFLCLQWRELLISLAMAGKEQVSYTEDNIRSLDWKEHIRMRPGMYIGKLGDGQAADDGIYVLLKEIIDNCIDEHAMGHVRAFASLSAMVKSRSAILAIAFRWVKWWTWCRSSTRG